jgi:hypothetical protein
MVITDRVQETKGNIGKHESQRPLHGKGQRSHETSRPILRRRAAIHKTPYVKYDFHRSKNLVAELKKLCNFTYDHTPPYLCSTATSTNFLK